MKARRRALKRKPWTLAIALSYAGIYGAFNPEGAERLERWALARHQELRRATLTGRPGGGKVGAC